MSDKEQLTEAEREQCQFAVQQAIRMLALAGFPLLQRYMKEVHRNNAEFDNVGAILYPGQYRDALYSGQLEDLKLQREIGDHLVKALGVAVQREERVKDGWK